MDSFAAELNNSLAELREQGLYRTLRRVDSPQQPRLEIDGRTVLNFSSNDYLGLAGDPTLKQAAISAVERFGAGSGASRLICGSIAPHHELEEALARFKGTEAALSFSSGYATAVGTIVALLGADDVIVVDKLVHACVVDAARLSGAKLRVFGHNNLNDLEKILRWADQRPRDESGRRPRILVVTESVFSMDGDQAPLREIVELKDQIGAWLMVDEAHATSLYGPRRRGLAEELGVGDRVEVQMGTLGKALGSSGGYVAGPRLLIDYLINRARSFIFSTAPVPAAAAAATAAVRFVESSEGEKRCASLRQLRLLLEESAAGSPIAGQLRQSRGAIIPILIGDESRAVETARALLKLGVFIPAIRYPTVARGQARLRLTLTAAHQADDVRELLAALAAVFN